MGRAYEVRKAAMAKTAAAKTKIYSRFGKEIYLAAKNGIPDPEMNQTLKRIIEKAKTQQVPTDVINRAIEKAKGNEQTNYEAVRYEGFGPEAATIIVDCLTDNVNRTVSEVRNCFTKTGGKLGVLGSVSFAYDELGVLSFEGFEEDKVMELLLDNEVDLVDVESEEEHLTVYVAPSDLYKAKDLIDTLGVSDYQVLEIEMLPQEYINFTTTESTTSFEKLLTMLNEVEDVTTIYHNVILD